MLRGFGNAQYAGDAHQVICRIDRVAGGAGSIERATRGERGMCGGEGAGVIEAITDHQDFVSLVRKRFHMGRFLKRFHAAMEVRNAKLLGDSPNAGRVVTGADLITDAELIECLDEFWCTQFDVF